MILGEYDGILTLDSSWNLYFTADGCCSSEEVDLDNLQSLSNEVGVISRSSDIKLKKLIEVVEEKFQNPINENNRKVIIFTAFADTANYLYNSLKDTIPKSV